MLNFYVKVKSIFEHIALFMGPCCEVYICVFIFCMQVPLNLHCTFTAHDFLHY